MNRADTSLPVVGRKRSNTTRSMVALLLVLLLIFAGAVYFRRDILDWLSLRGYTPPGDVVTLARADTMTDTAKRVYYVNHPAVEARPEFATNCKNNSEQTIVLGCYHGDQQGIFILSVSDPRLDGVMEVTAAHEMLHAEYDRLNARDRHQVDGWLQDFYRHQLKDKRVLATIEAYKKTEPNDVTNEMHSVFATEVANLPPNLEHYYERYFTSRATVVKFAEKYSSEFTRRQKQVASYDAELKQLKGQIDANEAQLKQEAVNLTAQRSALQRDHNRSDPSEYNQRVNSYNEDVSDYNAQLAATRQMIAQYNDLVERRNAIALEEQSLAEAMNGDMLPSKQ